MATQTIHFTQSSYFKANKGVDRYCIEHYLLPGLEVQAVIAGGSRGIELPVGENQTPEYLSLEEAKMLVLDWLEQNQNLLADDKKKLAKLKNYEQFADLASNIYQSQIQDPNKLLTATRLQNIADLRAKKTESATNSTPHYDPGKAIDDYNRLYLRLLSYSRIDIPHNLLQSIVSPGIPSGAGNLQEDALASVISANLSRLYAAGSVGSSESARNYAVAHELGNIIATSYPEMTGLLNLLGEPQTAANLREVTNRLAKELESTNASLAQYEKTQVSAITGVDVHLLNESELKTQINNIFSSMGIKDRDKLTNTLLTSIVSSAKQPLTTSQIIEQVGEKMGIPPEQLNIINSTLLASGLAVSLEYRQNKLSLMLGSRHLTLGEKNLLRKGINPFLVHNSPEKLSLLESKMLAEYNAIPGHNQQFVTLRDAYQAELQSSNSDHHFLNRSRSHFNQLGAYHDLSLSDRALINRTRFGRWVTDTRSRFYETQAKFFDKWVDLEETITGKKWLFKQLNKWDKFAENFTVTLGKNKIPIFHMVPWILDQWEGWKKAKTAKALVRTSGWTNPLGKFIHNRLKDYELGGYTIDGAFAHFASTQWGKLVKLSLAKTGMSGVFKYVGSSVSRTATRFLIKIGGKALVKLGAKALGALITATTAIGTVIFAISIVFDLISLGWTFLKEFINNLEFRKTVIKWGATIGAIFTSINLGGILLAIGAFFTGTMAGAVSLLLVAFAIVIATLVIVPQIQNNIKTTFHLDSEYVGPASSADFGASVSCASDGAVSGATTPGIPTRAEEIVSDLHTGFWNYCNRPTNPEMSELHLGVADTIQYPSVYKLSNRPNIFDYPLFKSSPDPTREEIQSSGNALYWCTYLVQHSYRESGNNKLANTLWSPTMEDDFRARKKFVEASAATPDNVQPGAVIFFKTDGGPDRTNHVGVVNSVHGAMLTFYQSNAPTINGFAEFRGGLQGPPGMPIVGIGNP